MIKNLQLLKVQKFEEEGGISSYYGDLTQQ